MIFLCHANYPPYSDFYNQGQKSIDISRRFVRHDISRVFEEYKVEKESRVLDFSCGIGRHSINLAKKDFQMVGYDPSPLFIEKAKLLADQELREEKQKIRFYNGTIRDFTEILSSSSNENNFKAITIMFNSIGYLSEDQDIRILKQLLSLADKGCILIMQTENRDWRIMNTPNNSIFEFDKVLINEVWKLNQYTSIAHGISKFYPRDSQNNCLNLRLDYK